jgi:hypothetical protein
VRRAGAVLLLAVLAAGAAAQPAPDRPLPGALVWLPPAAFSAWSEVDALLRARSDLKLTVALTPAQSDTLARDALAPWVQAGRVEVAARADGDPILPLVADHPDAPRPNDALERASGACRAVETRMRSGPPGFVPGAGSLDRALIQPLGASGAPWVLAGPYAVAGATWASAGRTVFVPAAAAGRDLLLGPADLTADGAVAVDESGLDRSSFLPALKALPSGARPESGWATVSELIRARGGAGADAAAVVSWPDWSGALSAPPSDPSALAAWRAYGAATATLERYKNSGAANLRTLERAVRLLHRAQDARFFRPPAPGAAPGLPSGLRDRLIAVYRLLKTSPPDALFQTGVSTAAAADLPTGVHAASGSNWVAFDNPAASQSRAPAGAPDAAPWSLRGLRVEWDDQNVLFRLFPGRVDAAPAAPKPVYDVYMDLNRILGAGSIPLLPGRGAFTQARDAWEFALSVSATEAQLWRAGFGDEPDEITTLAVERDPSRGEIRISVPRRLMRGDPARWGYVLLALTGDPARPGQSPAAVLGGDEGAQIFGLLGPLQEQTAVLGAPGAPARVGAVRLKPAAGL